MARPNVVVVLVDDMGYSDIGCYGGEIHTPNIDRLARDGRPVLAVLQHGALQPVARVAPDRTPSAPDRHRHADQRRPAARLPRHDQRALRHAGRGAQGRGLRHVPVRQVAPRVARCASPNDAWPTRRGFDRFFGTLTGCGSFFQPGTLTRGEENVEHEALAPISTTPTRSPTRRRRSSANARRAADQPFFLYVAYTAPHWPLHAREEDVAKYRGTFDAGWDVLRERRMQRLRELGILDDSAALSDRDPTQPAWNDAEYKEWQVRRMEVYAAQIDRMDKGVGRILAALEEAGELDDTLVIFLSDNGASDEALPLVELERFKERADILRVQDA